MSEMAIKRLSPTDCVIEVDGAKVAAREGETLAVALMTIGGWRPFYCGMGVCYACAITVDGIPGRRACLETVVDGMKVTTETVEFDERS